MLWRFGERHGRLRTGTPQASAEPRLHKQAQNWDPTSKLQAQRQDSTSRLGGGHSTLETSLASRWEGVKLPRASGKSPDFPGSSPNFPGSFSENFRERKFNTNCFFSNFSGTAGISRQNPGISRQKSLISLVSRDIPNFLAPTRSRGRPLPKRKISGLKVWVWVPFSCLKLPRKFSLCGTYQQPQVPRKSPKLPRKFPKLPRKFPDFPGGQPVSLGSLTPSADSQKLSLKLSD